jgi:hypothetical protein
MKRNQVLAVVTLAVAALLVPALPARALLVTEEPETVAPLAVDVSVSQEHTVYTGEYGATEAVTGLSLGTGLLKGAGIVRGLEVDVWVPYVRVAEDDPREKFEASEEPDVREPEQGIHASGLGDLEVALKWQFLDGAGAVPGMAARLGVSLPTGDEEEGLGSGTTVVSLGYLAGTPFESADVAVFLNAKVYYVVDAEEEQKDVFSECSLAASWWGLDPLGLSVEVAASTAEEEGAGTAATAATVVSCTVNDRFSLEAGLRLGLTDDAPDWVASAGVSLTFGGPGGMITPWSSGRR